MRTGCERHTDNEDSADGQGQALLVLEAGVQHAIPTVSGRLSISQGFVPTVSFRRVA